MGDVKFKHSDCFNFSNIDAAKGVCRISGEIVHIDTPVCGDFEKKLSCKLCRNFRKTVESSVGDCLASKENYWTYEDLNADNCEDFKSSED
jgi:4-hydroxyphenylacetate decarboxylase small subunit